MRSRIAEIAGSGILILSGVALAWTMAFDLPYETPQDTGPVKHLTDGTASRAFENKNTARLALAQFPLPVDSETATPVTEKLIKSIQMELARHGLDVGSADGTPSPKTREAITKYQEQMGLEVTGEASQLLFDHLGLTQPLREAAADPENGEMMRLIASVQTQLGDLGYEAGNASGVVTGETRAAIAEFERDTGLPVTGEVSYKLVQRLSRFEYTPL